MDSKEVASAQPQTPWMKGFLREINFLRETYGYRDKIDEIVRAAGVPVTQTVRVIVDIVDTTMTTSEIGDLVNEKLGAMPISLAARN